MGAVILPITRSKRKTKFLLIILFAAVFSVSSASLISDADAAPRHKRVSLEDLGLLQLAAHDFFNVNRGDFVNPETAFDFEDGKLNLSTLLDHGDENIVRGGEFRNRENIMLFTVASEFGEIYLALNEIVNKNKAREITVMIYHNELKDVYEKTFDEPFPDPEDGDATMTENLALRTLHDLLPGHIKIDGKMTSTLEPTLFGMTLSDSELQQDSDKLDGKFDHEFRKIRIFIPPDIDMIIDLLALDISFAEQFDTEFTFEELLEELKDGSYNADDEVMKLIRSLFAKGLNF